VLHLCSPLLEGRKSALNKNFTGLQGHLGGLTRLEFGQLAKDRAEVLADIADIRSVRAVLIQNRQDKGVLGRNPTVRKHSLDDFLDVLLVLFAELEDDLLILKATAREEALNIGIVVKQVSNDVELADLGTVSVEIQNLDKRLQSGLQEISIALRGHVLVQELLENLGKVAGRELGLSLLGALKGLGKLGIKLLGHTRVEGRELSSELAEGELRIAKNLDEILEGLQHDDLVVISHENVLEGAIENSEPL